jgi:hypothetical protein
MAREVPTLKIKVDVEALQQAIIEAFNPIREQVESIRENLLAMGGAVDELRKIVERWEVTTGGDRGSASTADQ